MKKNNSIKLDDIFLGEVFSARDNDPKYKQALENYNTALKSVTKSNEDLVKIDDAVVDMEAAAFDTIYKKAFHDGMRFILDAMAGKEVIEI